MPRPSTWARMPSGLIAVPTSVATVSFLTLTLAVVADRDMGDAAVQVEVLRSCEQTQATPMPSPFGSFFVP